MYLLLKVLVFHCYVSLPGVYIYIYNIQGWGRCQLQLGVKFHSSQNGEISPQGSTHEHLKALTKGLKKTPFATIVGEPPCIYIDILFISSRNLPTSKIHIPTFWWQQGIFPRLQPHRYLSKFVNIFLAIEGFRDLFGMVSKNVTRTQNLHLQWPWGNRKVTNWITWCHRFPFENLTFRYPPFCSKP